MLLITDVSVLLIQPRRIKTNNLAPYTPAVHRALAQRHSNRSKHSKEDSKERKKRRMDDKNKANTKKLLKVRAVLLYCTFISALWYIHSFFHGEKQHDQHNAFYY